MNFEMFKQDLFEAIDDIVGSVTDSKYVRSIFLAGMATIFVLGIYGVYWTFQKRKTTQAYESLVECLTKYKEGVADDAPDWNTIAALCAEKKAQHKSSNLASYFDLVHGDVLYKSGNFHGAVNAMKEASKRHGKNDISYLIRLKCALMQVDSDQAEWQNEGKEALIKLSEEKQNSMVDLALYQLGRYYYTHNEIEQAKKVWQTLADHSASSNHEPSAWASRAQQKLNQLL
jgi:predicted negative regulator of RcsB-dependent stress response